ncbi:MAG: 2-phospho-L-lactate transferase [Acidimicrobiales bacterium]|jgi:LPPG:FO 2-phospho-L-lactate transferase|nr:2-phospho-L-lactate transferase [Acidimicrobiales bacterium]
MLAALATVVDASDLCGVVNVGDDLDLHGLRICPDLDTITYTLAGEVDPATGWGLRDESWQAMEMVRRYGGADWFGLGDRDLGTHLYRTQRLHEGADLATVTAEIAATWGLSVRLVPATLDRLRTMVTLAEDDPPSPTGPALRAGAEVGFQEYFVQRRHDVAVADVRVDGAGTAAPAPGVLEAVAAADVVVIAPSNPIVSIGPVLAVAGMRAAVAGRRPDVVAVSPLVAGAALKGPAARLLAELGHEPSAVGVARLYADVAGTLVIDEADADLAPAVEAEGLRCVVSPTIMSEPGVATRLARTVLAAAGAPR